jgi:hypothetical protein
VRLVGGNEDVTHRRLRRLWERGLVNRWAFPGIRTHSEFYYYVDTRAPVDVLVTIQAPDAIELLRSEILTMMSWLGFSGTPVVPTTQRAAVGAMSSINLSTGELVNISTLPMGGPVTAKVVDLDGRMLRLNSDEPFPISSAVKVICRDTLLLGEIAKCCDMGSVWGLQMNIEHAVFGVAEVVDHCHHFMKALGAESPAAISVTPRVAPARLRLSASS